MSSNARSIPVYLPLVSILVASVVILGLTAAASPSRLGQRLGQVQRVSDQAISLERAAGGPAQWPIGAICNSSADQATADMTARVNRLVGQANLKSADLKVASEGLISSQLMAFSLHLKGAGEQRAVTSLLASLSPVRPEVFVDALDLKPSADGVSLELSGRFWCWAKI